MYFSLIIFAVASIIICINKNPIISLMASIFFCKKFNDATKICDVYYLIVRKKTIHSIRMSLTVLIHGLSLLHKYTSTSKNGFFLFWSDAIQKEKGMLPLCRQTVIDETWVFYLLNHGIRLTNEIVDKVWTTSQLPYHRFPKLKYEWKEI